MLETIVLDGNTFLLSIRNQKRAISSQNWALFSFPSFIYVEGRKKYAEGHCLMKDAYRDTTPLSPLSEFRQFRCKSRCKCTDREPPVVLQEHLAQGLLAPLFSMQYGLMGHHKSHVLAGSNEMRTVPPPPPSGIH